MGETVFGGIDMLTHITLHSIRNHEQFSLNVPEKGCCIIGANGSGKTTLLEAIFALATTKSFRAKQSAQLVQSGKDFGRILARTRTHRGEEELDFLWQLSPRKKTVFRRNHVTLSAQEMLKKKHFFATLFSPEDVLLPFTTPEKRRRYLNRVLAPLFPHHFQSLKKFKKILSSRNALLKRIAEGVASKEELDFFTAAFAEESEKITAARADFFEKNTEYIRKKYQEISGTNDDFCVVFAPHVKGNVQDVLEECYERDVARGATSKGAHHDDFFFLLRGKPLEETGSRGEVRSGILALKMAEHAFTKTVSGHTPILLLDDVFSELDATRRKHLAELVFTGQTIITATDMPKRALEEIDSDVIRLEEGHSFLENSEI